MKTYFLMKKNFILYFYLAHSFLLSNNFTLHYIENVDKNNLFGHIEQ